MTYFSTLWTDRGSRLMPAAACVFAGFLSACGGGSGSEAVAVLQPPSAAAGPTAPAPPLMPVMPANPVDEAALAASSPGMLLDYFKQKIKTRPAQTSQDFLLHTTAVPAVTALGSVSGNSEAPLAFSGTTLQERDVDENDWIKTDGSIVYGLTPSYYASSGTNTGAITLPQLQAQRRLADGQLAPLAKMSLSNDLTYSGMYLASAANRLALVGQKFKSSPALPALPVVTVLPATGGASAPLVAAPGLSTPASLSIAPGFMQSQIGIDLVGTPTPNNSSAATLSVTNRIRLDGRLVGSRVIGNTLYLVSTWDPNLGRYYALAANATAAQADAALAGLTSAEILPKIQIDNSPAEPLLADTDCYVQATNASRSVEVTSITAINLASSNLQRSSRCFLGGSQAMYMSSTAVYLASSRYLNGPINTLSSMVMPSNAKTDIHKFSLAGQTVNYRGSGEVAGHLGWEADKNAYRMSEFQGDLRVLTFTGQQGWTGPVNFNGQPVAAQSPASPATLTVLRETASKLLTVGTLPNANRPAAIGKPGEQIYAVKFVGPRAYVVTFRRIDPLYVLDLSNPADPKTLGELEIPGYSDYLFPIGDSLLLGVGKDANEAGVAQGVKVALMDVADPAKPLLRSSMVLGKIGSVSALDASSRGINIFQQGDVFRIALPVRLNETPATFAPGFFTPTTQGLARFEVDTRSKTLTRQPSIVGLTYPANSSSANLLSSSSANLLSYGLYNIGRERSVQIGSFVYYFSGGEFLSQAW